MVTATVCPERQEYLQMLQGKLPRAEVERLAVHLEGCPRCADIIGSLQADDTMVEAARRAEPVAFAEEEGKVTRSLMDRLRNLRHEAETTHGNNPADAGVPQPVAPEAYDFLAPPQAPDELGRLGGYRVLRVLGTGGMGVVFLAEDPQLKRHVALKAMKPSLAASDSARKRFLREAQATAALSHDHIVHIYQVGEDRGVPFLAMQYLQGETLDDRLKRDDKLPLAEVLRIGREVAAGLNAAHKRGLIHRDIKPGNLWLEAEGGRVKIVDFGLARAAGDDAHLTQTGAIVGTPAYMAPEQARGEAVDHRCDLFSLGGVLYRLCTGQLPFTGTNAMSMLLALATEHPLPPRQLNPDVPPALNTLILRLLAKNLPDRPASAQAVVEALRAIERDGAASAARTVALPAEPQPSPPTGPAETLQRPQPLPHGRASASRRWLAVAAGLLLLVGGGVLLQQVIIRITDKQGNTRDIELKPDEKAEILVKGPGGDVVKKPLPPLQIPAEPLPPIAGGEPLYPTALVSRPALLKGVQSWTIETVGHRHPVQVVAYSPDGKWLASMDSESLRIWETEGKYNLVRVLVAAPAGFTCLAWAPDAVHLATGHVGGEVGLWDVPAGRKLRTQKADGDVRSVSWSPDGKRLVAGTDKDQTFVWETASGKLLHQKKLGAVVACSPDGQTLATCNDAGRVQLWRAETLEHVRDCKFEWGAGPTNDLRSLSWTPNSKQLGLSARGVIVGAYSGGFRSWFLNAETGQLLHTEESRRTAGALSPDGKFLAKAYNDGSGIGFNQSDVNTGKVVRESVRELQGGALPSSITWSPDGTTLAIGSDMGVVSVWEVEAGQMRRVLEEQRYRALTTLSWSADGKMLHSAREDFLGRGLDGFLSWSTSTAEASSATGPPYPYCVSPDGKSRIVFIDNKTYALERKGRASGEFKEVHRKEWPHDYVLYAFGWSPDGSLLLAPNGEKKLELHDLSTGKLLRTYPLSASVTAVALAPDGKTFAVLAGEELLFMEVQSGTTIDRQRFGEVGSLAFSPDGKTLAMGLTEGRIELRSADATKVRRTLTSPGGGSVVSLAWSPDGKTLATGGYYAPGPTRLWDAGTGQLRCLLVALPDNKALAIMPDGHYRGTPSGMERHLVYVIQTDQGQETLTPEEFTTRYGWKNDPDRVRLSP
jgi:serine/threonine protein kinase/WD40 repeat protein